MYEGARISDYAIQVAATNRRLRADAASPAAIVREAAKALRWFEMPQPADAIGPPSGIYSEAAFAFGTDTYLLRACAHTATGKPALQLVTIPPGVMSIEPIPTCDRALFRSLIDRLSRGRAIAEWEVIDGYSVSVGMRAHPSLVKAVTSNRHRINPERGSQLFKLPLAWRV